MDLIIVTRKVKSGVYLLQKHDAKKPETSVEMAKQILVIPAPSAQSECHLSTKGKVTRKDRANVSSSTVEASVLVAQALPQEGCYISGTINHLKDSCEL